MNRKLLLSVSLAVAAVAAIGGAVAMMWSPREEALASEAAVEGDALENGLPARQRRTVRVIKEEPDALAPVSSSPTHALAGGPTPVLRRLPELAPLMELAGRDLAAALEKIKDAYAESGWQEMQATLGAHLLAKDFTRAPEFCALVESSVMQLALAHSLPAAYRRDRAGTATVVFDQLTNYARDFAAWQIVLCQLETGDLAAAMQTHLRVPSSSESLRSASDIATKIGSGDLGAGLLWFEQLATDGERRAAHSRMAENLRKAGDADGLLRLFAVIPSDEKAKRDGMFRWDRSSFITEIARLGRQTRNDAAVNALRAVVSGHEIEFLELGLLQGERDGSVEERFARARALTHAETRGKAASAVIGAEVSKEPKHAAEFVIGLDDASFTTGLRPLMAHWGAKDDEGLAAWIRGLPSGTRREQAIASFVEMNRYRNDDQRKLAREIASLAADPAEIERLTHSIREPASPKGSGAGGR